jgi:hypothetical protein
VNKTVDICFAAANAGRTERATYWLGVRE